MRVQECFNNHRIERLTKLMQELEQSRSVDETLRLTRRGLADARGVVSTLLISNRGLRAGEYQLVRSDLEYKAYHGATAGNPDRLKTDGHIWSGGPLAEIVARRAPQLVQGVDWSTDASLEGALGRYGSVIAVPLAGDRLPMNWVILLKERPQMFTESDLEAAVECAALIAALLKNQTLAAELVAANERLERDARQVGDLQRRLLPASPPSVAELEVAASFEPCARAGGDLYDFFPLEGEVDEPSRGAATHWCVFIGDAAGHGLATAIVIAIVQAVLHARPAGAMNPAGLLSHANRQLCARGLGGFVTAFLGVYEPRSRRLTFANAGHPPPLLRRKSDGSVRALDGVASVPLGIDQAESFKEAFVQLDAGDTVLLYTDGVTEARSRTGDFFGYDRLTRILRGACDDHPGGLIAHLRSAVMSMQDGRPAEDDQTLVAARIL